MKKQRLSVAMAVLAAGLLLAGCSSKVTQTSQYSGFLSDYSKLQETTSPSGHKTLRWVDPSYKESTSNRWSISRRRNQPRASARTR